MGVAKFTHHTVVDRFKGNYSATGRAKCSSGRGKSITPLVWPTAASKGNGARNIGSRLLGATNPQVCSLLELSVHQSVDSAVH